MSHAVASDLTKIGKGGFGGDGAEVRVRVERLEELGGPHGFSEAKDATRMILCLQEIEPLVDVVALEEAVGSERAAAGAVGAGVGEQYGESALKEELSVSRHADAVVAETVEEEDGVSVGMMRTDEPGTEGDGVRCGDGDVSEVGVEAKRRLPDRGGFFIGKRAAGGMESAVGDEDAADYAEDEIQE